MLENLWNCLHYIFNFHVVQIYVSLLLRVALFRQAIQARVEGGGGEWLRLIRPGRGCLRSAERRVRIAEGGGRMSAERGGTAECGARSAGQPVSAEPAGVCRAGRCLRSAECMRIGRSADRRLRGRPISAERGPRSTAAGLIRTTEFCCSVRQAVLFRQATGGRVACRFPTRPTRSAAALHRHGVRNVERSKG